MLEHLANLLQSGLLCRRIYVALREFREVEFNVVSTSYPTVFLKPSRHEVLEVNNLGKHLHGSLLVHLLLIHSSSHLARWSSNSTNESVRELVLSVSFLVYLHDDSFLSSILARENDNDLSRLKTLHHLQKS